MMARIGKYLLFFYACCVVHATPQQPLLNSRSIISSGGGGQTNIIPHIFWYVGTNNGGTTVTDSSGNGNTGTASGATYQLTSSGILFGAGGQVAAPSSTQTAAFTYIAWINTTNNAGNPQTIFGSSQSGGVQLRLSGSGSSSQPMQFLSEGTALIGTSSGSVAVGNGSWTQVAITFDGSFNYHFYTNGFDAGGNGTYSSALSLTGHIVLGYNPPGSGEGLYGYGIGFRADNYAYTAGQVSNIYYWSKANNDY